MQIKANNNRMQIYIRNNYNSIIERAKVELIKIVSIDRSRLGQESYWAKIMRKEGKISGLSKPHKDRSYDVNI
jgi:hypothetical protein